jgi:hypothetical protein
MKRQEKSFSKALRLPASEQAANATRRYARERQKEVTNWMAPVQQALADASKPQRR